MIGEVWTCRCEADIEALARDGCNVFHIHVEDDELPRPGQKCVIRDPAGAFLVGKVEQVTTNGTVTIIPTVALTRD